jgi:hypothetical protein
MSNCSRGTKLSGLLVVMVIFLLLSPHALHAQATHTGAFNSLGANTSLLIYQNQTGVTHPVFVTVCVNGGGPVNVVGPFSPFTVATSGCRTSSVELSPNNAIGLNLTVAGTATGTYQVSTPVTRGAP